MWQRIRSWARQLKADTIALWFCCRHPATPLPAKILATLVVAYALSPIDLIPDFIPVIGYLDELFILPLGIWLVVWLIPDGIMVEYRARANEAGQRPTSRAGMAAILLVWMVSALALGWLAHAWWSRP